MTRPSRSDCVVIKPVSREFAVQLYPLRFCPILSRTYVREDTIRHDKHASSRQRKGRTDGRTDEENQGVNEADAPWGANQHGSHIRAFVDPTLPRTSWTPWDTARQTRK
ncbi:PREDICTED: uncharacterized protein LOC108750829 [Trachymyrmex septentrionalis]|uniref:uncharacterized protein LOC108750829 n=1 Tax=Trachymyrmex septentrionalis TaxID=34720 RepID=UPI00084F7CEF|nr:PREDICTED: uncharacterized protein LOC108750829 [Trachymyrmex septentrionalis]